MRRQFSDQQHDAYVGHLLRDALSGRASAEVLAELGLDPLEEHCVVLVAALDRPAADQQGATSRRLQRRPRGAEHVLQQLAAGDWLGRAAHA